MLDEGRRVVGVELLGQSEHQLRSLAESLGYRSFVGSQLAHWLYVQRVDRFSGMSNLPGRLRDLLENDYRLGRYSPRQVAESSDGTRKYLYDVVSLLSARGSRSVETAVIPDGDRLTVCLSCQSGCRMGCLFCATGAQGFGGNLNAGEIVNQLLSLPEYERVSNLVLMGMGEPLDNYDAVVGALDVFTGSWGLGMSPRRITLSSVGVSSNLERFVRERSCHLAVSLHSPYDEERQWLIPAARGHYIADLMNVLLRGDWQGQRRLSFEYVVLRGVNDSVRHVLALAHLLRGLPVRVNLIPYHPTGGANDRFGSPSADRVDAMSLELNDLGVRTTVRASRGEDIGAACGMLSRTAG